MSYTFKTVHEIDSMPGITQFWGVAVHKIRSQMSRFYLTVSPISVTLSVDPTEEGKKLIIYFVKILGEPELILRDTKTAECLDDYTARWYQIENSKTTTQRIKHLINGFKP
ncbi:hypothetical protein [Candidatus Bathycorpusculum sp.]|jgi:hypothetical protein|uniref:hypothetical protein n=1 Tax=Candidatus Bathycorpusculum sp. TaxID=2994959 RepID=UPI00282859C0|nr:hypothetical protein [Candidatus Termitimicrobium sp.]MCL2685657.1 hypothetical protein [Candidatus Termitimicrobium sp.]